MLIQAVKRPWVLVFISISMALNLISFPKYMASALLDRAVYIAGFLGVRQRFQKI